ncbi:GATA zinc finger domain-containing protein [Fusarium denticulatum]|uniref:GATA zinc finger domain-containing protein n=1 Tax=Fusarium denticulatum TaxID=48507 RepID=A0A8H5WLG3_9HYPO|nr:GATA zinc finger domain-containing protein [Fusarium denticulatum]
MESSPSSVDSGPSNHQKPPSLAEIIKPHRVNSHRGLGPPSASASRRPSPIKVERPSLPKPIHPDFNLPSRLPTSSTVFPNLHAPALIFSPAAQARHKDVLDSSPGNQTYREMLGQIMSRSHAILNFAEANRRTALKQYSTQVNPARLPREQDINEMLRNQEILKQLLQQVNSLQFSLRARSDPGLPQQHMIGMSNRMTIPGIVSTEVAKPDLVSRYSLEARLRLTVNSPAFFWRDVAIALDLLLAYRDSDRKKGRLYAEIAILSKQDRELNKAPGVVELSEALNFWQSSQCR